MRHWINSLRPTKQNGCHFADDTFKSIFLDENGGISIKISLKFVHKGPINNIPALVQMMAWRQPGNKPLSETMVVRLPTYICVTRPQWVNENRPYYLHPCRSWWMPLTWVFCPNKPWWRHQMETKKMWASCILFGDVLWGRLLNSLRAKQNGNHLCRQYLKTHHLHPCILLKFHWNMSAWYQLTISCHEVYALWCLVVVPD